MVHLRPTVLGPRLPTINGLPLVAVWRDVSIVSVPIVMFSLRVIVQWVLDRPRMVRSRQVTRHGELGQQSVHANYCIGLRPPCLYTLGHPIHSSVAK